MEVGEKKAYSLIKGKDNIMQSIFEYLREIKELLEQLNAITQNQTTILLGEQDEIENEDEVLGLLEGMVEYKDEVIKTLTEVEEKFQNAYEQYKQELIAKGFMARVKNEVTYILNLKNEIAEREQSNVSIMQSRMQMKNKQIRVQPTNIQMVEAYKKQQRKP